MARALGPASNCRTQADFRGVIRVGRDVVAFPCLKIETLVTLMLWIDQHLSRSGLLAAGRRPHWKMPDCKGKYSADPNHA